MEKCIMNKAFIIGNGSSRLEFDLNKMTGKGVMFGCNALYRDHKPDYLVAIDLEIIEEINKSNFPKHRFIVPPERDQFEPVEYSDGKVRSNAGMNCMIEAIKRNFDTLYCLGFDFLQVNEESIMSNVYKDSNAYGPATRTTYDDSIKRVAYLDWFAEKNPKIKFTMLFPRGDLDIHDIKSNNIMFMFYDDFEKELL